MTMTEIQIRPLRDDVISLDPPGVRGVNCAQCERKSFPLREVCPFCGSPDVEHIVLSSRGKVVSWTVVHQAPPPLQTPYRLVTVDLDDGVRLLGTATANPGIGCDVDVALVPHGTDQEGNSLCWYRFETVEDR